MTMGQTYKVYSSPKPKVPRKEAVRRIEEQIEIGRAIRETRIFSMMDLDNAQERKTKWLEDQTQVLTLLFSDSFLEEAISTDISSDIDSAITFGLKEKYFKDNINEQIGKLESILERLKQDETEDLMEGSMRQEQLMVVQPIESRTAEKTSRGKPIRREPPREPPSIEKPLHGQALKEPPRGKRPSRENPQPSMVSNQSQLPGTNILLIHGQDEIAKGPVLEFIEKLGLQAITADEQPHGGKGLIERFRETPNIHFAIVLFTPGNTTPPQGKAKGTRVRMIHDIIFEFGYAVAKLGYERVIALCQEGVEIPFDYPGVVFIPTDSRGRWKLLVAKEIKLAGIEIDLNKAI
jgi:predicted nucleotide-binding protein